MQLWLLWDPGDFRCNVRGLGGALPSPHTVTPGGSHQDWEPSCLLPTAQCLHPAPKGALETLLSRVAQGCCCPQAAA